MGDVFTPLHVIKRQMVASKFCYWFVTTGDSTKLGDYTLVGGNPDDSFEALTQFLADLEGDYVVVIIRGKLPSKVDEATGEKSSGNTPYFRYKVRLANQAPGREVGGMFGMAGGSSFIQMLMEQGKQIADLNNKLVNKDMEFELKQLREKMDKGPDKDSHMNRLFEVIADKVVEAAYSEGGFKLPEKKIASEPAKTEPVAAVTEEQRKTMEKQVSDDMMFIAKNLGKDAPAFYRGMAKFMEQHPETAKEQAGQIINYGT